jgi:hypothetical protein
MKVRIIRVLPEGYEVQVWHWWFPFWIQLGYSTFYNLEAAERYAMCAFKKVVKVIE